ncbi:hypothetical protein AX16_007495 [Volvariella volvacea WC 439]|nr:hypothetical protein AX16_007495 [Volvariella volvacea WC 439]
MESRPGVAGHRPSRRNTKRAGRHLPVHPSNYHSQQGHSRPLPVLQISREPYRHSSFADPCTPLEGGFDSGFVFIPPNTSSDAVPEWNLTITEDDTPIWFFCKQLLPAPHCTAGMVGAINPPSSGNTFQAFQQNAQSFSGAPGQAQGGLVGAGASASAFPGPLAGGEQLFTGGPAAASAPGPAHVPSAPTESASGAGRVGVAAAGAGVAVLAGVLGAVLV